MSDLVERLADLTAHRDRDVLDASLVGALCELLAPASVAVHRCVGDEANRRWLTRARMAAGDVATAADNAWAEIDLLPRLDDRPAWRDCLRSQNPLNPEGSSATALLPLAADTGTVGVLELRTERALALSDYRSVSSILRLYRNFEGLLDYCERDTPDRPAQPQDLRRRLSQAGVAARRYARARWRAPRRRGGCPLPGRYRHRPLQARQRQLRPPDRGRSVAAAVACHARHFRDHDRLYRFGGEEFVVLMRCADDASAAIAFERLRANVAKYAFPQVGHITVSVGYTAVNGRDTPSRAFERADRAVYFAKEHGRDQVRSHAALVATGLLEGEHQTGDVELF